MAEFSASVFQNEYLSDGATDVHAIVTVTASGTGSAGSDGAAAEIIIVDCSGSMTGENMAAAKRAAQVAVDQILDGTFFAVVAGSERADRAFPYPNASVSMVRMEPGARAAAREAIGYLQADGGTAMGSWLTLARQLFATVPEATQRHAILLTDGKNEHESRMQLDAAIRAAQGAFQCDVRGVGTRWVVEEARTIASALLGTVGLIANPADMAADFEQLMQASMGRGVANGELRVTPQGAQLLFVRQVAPNLEDLSSRRTPVNPLTGSYPTGAWGDESREYHVAVRVASKPVGAEQLAARVQLSVRDEVVASALVKARWTDDSALTARIDPAVAHYTGQTELASAIQDGLAAKAAGDDATATVKLGRAVQLAAVTGNDEATAKLRKVVEIDNPNEGTVRLKRGVTRLDEMALDTASTKTTRVRK